MLAGERQGGGLGLGRWEEGLWQGGGKVIRLAGGHLAEERCGEKNRGKLWQV